MPVKSKPHLLRSAEQLGRTVQIIRREKKLSQVALAEKAGLTQGTVSRLESGNQEAEISTVIAVAAALGYELTFSPASSRKTASDDFEGLY